MNHRLFHRLGVAVLLCTTAAAQADPALLGLTFGEPLSIPECAWTAIGRYRDYRVSASSEGACYARTPVKIGSTDPLVDELVGVRWPILKGPSIAKDDGVSVRLVQGRVALVLVQTRGAGVQEETFDQLVTKFGKPEASEGRPVQTLMGAKTASIDALWVINGVRIVFKGISGSLDRGEIQAGTEEGINAQRQAMEKLLGKGVSL